MKLVLGMLIGIGCVCSLGFISSCKESHSLNPKSLVDVSLLEVGGHEYVVSTIRTRSMDGGCAISTMHHVGCKACNIENK